LVNKSADPCDDFYEFACGNFDQIEAIPKDRSFVSWTWTTIDESVLHQVHRVLETDTGPAGDYYNACMNMSELNERGYGPLQKWVHTIDTLMDGTKEGLSKTLATLHAGEVPGVFKPDVRADDHDDTNVLELHVDSYLLPGPRYYTSSDSESRKQRQDYVELGKALTQECGVPNAQKLVEESLDVETTYARYDAGTAVPPINCAEKHFNLTEMQTAMGASFDWELYFTTLFKESHVNMTEVDPNKITYLVYCPEAINRMLQDLLHNTTAARSYLTWHLIYNVSPILPEKAYDLSVKLQNIFTGAKKIQSRWRKCTRAVSNALRMEVARLYVDKALSLSTLVSANAMVRTIHDEFANILKGTVWMGNQTRADALKKIAAMKLEVGVPSDRSQAFLEYEYKIDKTKYFENAFAASRDRVGRRLQTLTHPINRVHWSMSPCEANAYYDCTLNSLFIPAAMLNVPFFSTSAALARNFGSLGFIVGHETTHGFDDNGRQFDENGKKVNWWTKKDHDNFHSRAMCVADFYHSFTSAGKHVRGNMTLDEDIADIGGLHAAWKGFRKLYRKKLNTSPNDFSRKMFMTSAAQTWCTVSRHKNLMLQVRTDEHAPDKVRVNGALAQLVGFADTFQCPAGTPMHPKDRCGMWT